VSAVTGVQTVARQPVDPSLVPVYLRALGGDAAVMPLWFDAHVLDRYRATTGWRVIRTNTVGRVRSPEGWSLDFGIAAGDALIHASAADLAQRLPAADRRHWAEHIVAWPVSKNFVSMRLGAGACVDDGELRDWPA